MSVICDCGCDDRGNYVASLVLIFVASNSAPRITRLVLFTLDNACFYFCLPLRIEMRSLLINSIIGHADDVVAFTQFLY